MDSKSWKESKIFHFCYVITFITSGIIINIIQTCLYFTLRIYNENLFIRLNYYLAYSIFSQLIFLFSWWSGSNMSIFVDSEDSHKYYGKENALIIMNHYYRLDWLFLINLANNYNILGSIRSFSKKSFQYVPVLGICCKLCGFIFVNKSIEKDKDLIENKINEFINSPITKWLVLHPEGTRFTKSKHEESQKFSEKNGLPLLKYHLTPRTKGFTTTVGMLRGKIDALYDLNIACKSDAEVAPTLNNLLSGRKIHPYIHITRIPLSEVPENEKEANKWLHDRFVVKDKLHESFLKTGDFFAESGMKKTTEITISRNIYVLMNMTFWGAIILIPAAKCILSTLLSGNIVHILIVILVFGIVHVIMQQFIGMTVVKETSPTGLENKIKARDG